MAQFQLLGPVEVRVDGRLVDAGQPRQRCVLAALLVDAGRLVTWDSLVERVWGESPPNGVRASLYSHIARIRQMLRTMERPDAPAPELERHKGGYMLCADPDQIDLHRFQRLLDLARVPTASSEQQLALLREAVALWRGEPLAGLAGDWAARTREAWYQRRLHAMAAWGRAELAAGNAAVVIEPMTTLLDENPLAEPVAATLIHALHTVGHTAGALERYRRLHRHLAEELGTDPCSELQQLHQAILRGEISPLALASAKPHRPGKQESPAQLPMPPPGFAGRHTEMARLDEIAEVSPRSAMTIVTVFGTAGVGKTSLAVYWAHQVAQDFPDGQLYVNLRGFDPSAPPMAPAEAVRGFLDAFEVSPHRIPATLAAQTALFRSVVANRRILVLLDNARDEEQVRPLLPGTPSCFALVTSRSRLTGLVTSEGAHPITLNLLSVVEARRLLARRVGRERVEAEAATVEEVIDRCARLPLALVIVAARMAASDGVSFGAVLKELQQSKQTLDEFSGRDAATNVRSVFSWSYRALSPAAARMFRLLGLHPGPHATLDVSANLAGVDLPKARESVDELTHAHLVTRPVPGRLVLHDLLRVYAAELAHQTDKEPLRSASLLRMYDHYVQTAYTADRLLHPRRDPIDLGPAVAGSWAVALPDESHATSWFDAEHPVLLNAVRHAFEIGFDDHAWRLAWAMSTFLDRRGHWEQWLATQEIALLAARRGGHEAGQIQAHRGIAAACAWLERLDDACAHLDDALTLLDRLQDRAGLANTHLDFTWIRERQSRPHDVLTHATQALTLYQDLNHLPGQARALNTVGWAHALLGDYRNTLVRCGQAMTLLQQLGDQAGEAHTWDSLGYAHRHLDDLLTSVDCYRHAVGLFHELGDRYYEADSLNSLGEAYRLGGDLDAARRAWREAFDILQQLGHASAHAISSKLDTEASGLARDVSREP